MSVAMSVRLTSDVEASAESYMTQSGWNRTLLVNTALNEWLRIQAHPGIRFISTPTGKRIAALVNGPEIWTIAESWQQHNLSERTIDNLVQATGLEREEVDVALAYYADFKDEIDTEISIVHAAQEQAREAWERRQALHA